jgi:hypothetical protein
MRECSQYFGFAREWLRKGGREMQRQDYCVYNQTNECFLSLGATLGDRPFARLKQWIGLGRRRADEGTWFRPYERKHALTLFMTRDLVYLDVRQRVVHLIESFPALRSVPPRPDAATLLALPVHAISSSQTRLGNQLLICAPAEMERKLRKLFEPSLNSQKQQPARLSLLAIEPRRQPRVQAALELTHCAPVSAARECLPPPPPPCLDAGPLSLHAIRDLNPAGLYLLTSERWPIGAEINMSLQPGGIHQDSCSPVTVRMRVTRWGADGVGLEFAGAAAEVSALKSHHVC